MDGSRTPFPLRLCLTLCGLMATLPFLFPYHYFPFLTFYNEWFAFTIGLAALGVMGLAPSRHAVPVPAMCLGLFAFTAVLALQVVLGQVAYPLRSGMGALYTIWAALIVLLGAWLGTAAGERPVAHALQWWLALAGTLVAASGFIQYYHTPLLFGTVVMAPLANALVGTIGQPNNLANYLGIALLSVACLHARGALGFAPAALIVVLAAGAMALSGSRTSWGYMAIVFAVVPLLVRGGHREARRRFLRIAVLGLAVFAMVQALNLYTDVFTGPEGRPLSAGERFAKYLAIDGASSVRPIRLQLFLYGWLMFLGNPILGVGFGEYGWHAFGLAADLPGAIPPGMDRHSHNLFLQLLAETGVAGFLCIAVPLGSWLLRNSWRNLGPERCWSIGVLAIMGLHSMVEFPLWHANFLGLFALLFGTTSPAFAALELNRLRRALFLMVVVAGALAARSVWSDYRAFEAWFLKVEARAKRGGLSDGADFESLIALQENSFFAPYFDRVLTEVMELDERNLEDKLAFNAQAMRTYPAPPMVHRQIVLLAIAGRDAEAARMLRAAVRVYPQWTREWLPQLEAFARARPERFAGLLASARAQLDQAEPGRAFAPLPGKR